MVSNLTSFVTGILLLSALALGSQKPVQAQLTQPKPKACVSLPPPDVPGASIVTMSAAEVLDGSATSYCDINVTLTHGSSGDKVRVQVWMPLDAKEWNGRFQATGGGGFVAGLFEQYLEPALVDGYAAASTDAGLTKEDGSEMARNAQLMTNFASVSLHEMAVVGKALVESFYGRPAAFSYWNGCSTGGRQGMMEAQKYPDDFDGILAVAPAINMAKFVIADLYPYVVMNQEGEIVPKCVFDALERYNVLACDTDDGAEDGLISEPHSCEFDAQMVVGQPTKCENVGLKTITARQAKIYNLIRAGGPVSENGTQLWYGLMAGAKFTELAKNPPFDIARWWVRDFVLENPQLEFSSITNDMLADILHKSQERWGPIIGTDSPDLSAFRDKGGKILTWHGLADDCIFPGGTFDYKEKVNAIMGGASAVDEFYRVFQAPGVGHCFGGNGAAPFKELDVLVSWVEHGIAPETLPASITNENNVTVTRNLCRYPQNLKYSGSGDINKASSWTCV